jgi:PAS domain S-box-containing protein
MTDPVSPPVPAAPPEGAASTPEETAQRYAQILSALGRMDAGLILYGPDDRVVFANDLVRAFYPEVAHLLVPGVAYADISREHHRRFFHEQTELDEDAYVRSRVEAHRGACDADFEFQAVDGRWLLVSDRRTPDGGIVGLRVDITARKRAEHALRASEERQQLALAAGRLVAWEWAVGDARILWGEGAEIVLGPLPPGVAGYPDFRDMVHPEDRERYLETGRRAFEQGGVYRCEFRLRWLDGRVRWIKAQGVVRHGAPGERGRLFGITQDITDRVAAGEALRESEARYRTLLETTTDAVVMINLEGVIRYVNPAVGALFGWSPDELVGRELSVLQPERLRAMCGRGIARFAADGDRRVNWRAMESIGLHRDGHEFPLELSFSVTGMGGERFLVAFLRDIATRKRAEFELHEMNATLERRVAERTSELSQVNRELESFSYTVAHDLRAPLRAIDGFSRVLEDELGEALEPEARRYLSRIRINTDLMARMIDELLDFSRIGRADLAVRPVALESLARLVADELSPAYPLSRIEIGSPLPSVSGDPTLLRIVLANLVGNALKFSSRAASPCVRIGAVREGGEVVLSVADNGVGFDPQYGDKLFGVFQRLHTREEFEGTGIGLATVARVVSRHGGRAWAESTPGSGATFHVALPVVAGGPA